ncbi:MAG: hypothetical protein AW07_00992 [Candidatus Accumulibacter sp. SK-11]|nr:MAG: hypothetical protein AW07_00992 [Candidatus Accumulibacter sp. SK-11]
MHQNRYAMTPQEQRQQRRQVGATTGAVVARDDDRLGADAGALQFRQPLVGSGEKADHFVDRLGLHAQRDGDCAEFEIGNHPVEHGPVKLPRLVAGQVTRTRRATSDFPDQKRQIHVPPSRCRQITVAVARNRGKTANHSGQRAAPLAADHDAIEPASYYFPPMETPLGPTRAALVPLGSSNSRATHQGMAHGVAVGGSTCSPRRSWVLVAGEAFAGTRCQ